MQRLVISVLLLSLTVAAQGGASARSKTPGHENDLSAKFSQLSEAFIHETLALSPSNASQAGYHKHLDPATGKTVELDALLDDVSPSGVAAQRGLYVRWRERFQRETPLRSLDAQDAADWQVIDDQIALNLLELDRIHPLGGVGIPRSLSTSAQHEVVPALCAFPDEDRQHLISFGLTKSCYSFVRATLNRARGKNAPQFLAGCCSRFN